MNETNLDDLYRLQAARTGEIQLKGENFTYENSTRGFKAVNNDDGTMFAEPHAVFGKHQIINSAQGGSYIVISAVKQAGRQLIKVAPVVGSLQVFQPSGARLIQKHYSLPYSSGFMVVPGTVAVGNVVQSGSSKYQVTGKSSTPEGLERLALVNYVPPTPAPNTVAGVRRLW
jgi:hypothetical protein